VLTKYQPITSITSLSHVKKNKTPKIPKKHPKIPKKHPKKHKKTQKIPKTPKMPQLKNCLICEKEIFRGRDPNRLKRNPNAVTCSKECAKKYNRVFQYVKMKIKRNNEEKPKTQPKCLQCKKKPVLKGFFCSFDCKQTYTQKTEEKRLYRS